MSRIGKKPVPVPAGVTASIDGQVVTAKGPKGELSFACLDLVTVENSEDGIVVAPVNQSKEARSLWGMTRTMILNIMTGVSSGFEKKLEMNGVGYRAQMKGSDLSIAVGYSHDVLYKAPEGVSIAVPKPTEIVISGIDKQKVGQAAAEIREFRPPEPYKGKGIKYADEYIFRKEGKKK